MEVIILIIALILVLLLIPGKPGEVLPFRCDMHYWEIQEGKMVCGRCHFTPSAEVRTETEEYDELD